MRKVLITLSLLAGLWFLALGTKEFVLRVQGERAEATLISADLSAVISHAEKLRLKGKSARGYFIAKVPLSYRFQLSSGPNQEVQIFEGSDVLHWKIKDGETDPVKLGMPIGIVYLRSHPGWNAAYQPVVLVIYGTLFALVGSVFLALAALLWRYRKPKFTGSSTPSPFPADIA